MFKSNDLQLPEPSAEKPLVQIDFIFNRLAQVRPSSRAHIRLALRFYKNYLAKTQNYDLNLSDRKPFLIKQQWDSFALIKAQCFLDSNNTASSVPRFTSGTVTSIIGALRRVMQYAASQNLTKEQHILSLACGPVRRETTVAAGYSKTEEELISQWLYEKVHQTYALLQVKNYQRIGVGHDPRIGPTCLERDKCTPRFCSGWQITENLRWYFENVMHCEADYKKVPSHHPHYWFYYHASNRPGGYQQLFLDWRIKPIITLDMIMPLALKLCFETGLNPDSLWNLTVDCFQERHPLTGMAYLQYYKGRSRGEMEMHLNPYTKGTIICEFKEAQARIIRETVAQLRQATASLRPYAPKGCENKLFLYQSLGSNMGKVLHLHGDTASVWCRQQVVDAQLKADNGQPLQLTAQRFRPTKIMNMVLRGEDFFAIRDLMGHLSIKTTLEYLERNQLEYKANQETLEALQTIHDNQLWQQAAQPQYANVQPATDETIYKGILADCRNVYDPPSEVKKLKDYQPTQACTRFNMCLFCKNVVVMRHHLPALVVYQRQIQQAMGNNITELPNAQHYQRTLNVLQNILDPVKSEFSLEDIMWATAAAECLDLIVDPVVYRATQQE